MLAGDTGLVGTAMYVSPELLKQDVRYSQVHVLCYDNPCDNSPPTNNPCPFEYQQLISALPAHLNSKTLVQFQMNLGCIYIHVCVEIVKFLRTCI